jgi:hypothetical protein
MGILTVARERTRRAGEGYPREESLCHAKTLMPSFADFCIYARFDPPFAKLLNLPKPIVKPLEDDF